MNHLIYSKLFQTLMTKEQYKEVLSKIMYLPHEDETLTLICVYD